MQGPEVIDDEEPLEIGRSGKKQKSGTRAENRAKKGNPDRSIKVTAMCMAAT